jgi:RNA polymerase sigma-70 factor (ECF subfamily)
VRDDRRNDAMAAEQALVGRARLGDQAAFRALVERYEGLVAATVTGMLGTGAEADDVGQNTFIRFYQSLDQYRGEGGVAPYLTRIAINLSLNALEKRKRRLKTFFSREELPPLTDPIHEGDQELQQIEWQRIIQRALNRLRPKHRAVVVLRLIDGYSTQETAELLDVPVGTVLSRLARAQKQLKNLLEPYLKEYET